MLKPKRKKKREPRLCSVCGKPLVNMNTEHATMHKECHPFPTRRWGWLQADERLFRDE